MQSVSSRIWTRVTVSIYYDDNHYTTGTSTLNNQQWLICNEIMPNQTNYPVSWDCWIHQLHLCWGVRHPTNVFPGYDTKQCNSEVPVMLELWEMRSTPLLPSLSGPLLPRVVAPDRVLSMGQLELNRVLMLNRIVWNVTGFF